MTEPGHAASNGSRRRRRFLSPSEKYELWLGLVRGESTIREAADALGVARWRSIVGVILPTASNGIVTATILAVARAAGETAPVLFASAVFRFVK